MWTVGRIFWHVMMCILIPAGTHEMLWAWLSTASICQAAGWLNSINCDQVVSTVEGLQGCVGVFWSWNLEHVLCHEWHGIGGCGGWYLGRNLVFQLWIWLLLYGHWCFYENCSGLGRWHKVLACLGTLGRWGNWSFGKSMCTFWSNLCICFLLMGLWNFWWGLSLASGGYGCW